MSEDELLHELEASTWAPHCPGWCIEQHPPLESWQIAGGGGWTHLAWAVETLTGVSVRVVAYEAIDGRWEPVGVDIEGDVDVLFAPALVYELADAVREAGDRLAALRGAPTAASSSGRQGQSGFAE